jgi:hypothetical protein
MQKKVAQVYGILIAFLAVAGLMTNGHLFELMNVDGFLDVLRIALAVALLAVGFGAASLTAARSVLSFTGILYLGMALVGLFDSKFFGLLPSGLTGFDIAFHFITGAFATWAAFASESDHKPARA